jgi:hypothetical protein
MLNIVHTVVKQRYGGNIMAAIDIKAAIKQVNWNEVKDEVSSGRKKSTDMVEVIESGARAIMADGKEYEVVRIQHLIEFALNKDAQEGDDKIAVNWITVRYVMDKKQGFREVSKNTFVLDPSYKKVATKKATVGKKQ